MLYQIKQITGSATITQNDKISPFKSSIKKAQLLIGVLKNMNYLGSEKNNGRLQGRKPRRKKENRKENPTSPLSLFPFATCPSSRGHFADEKKHY